MLSLNALKSFSLATGLICIACLMLLGCGSSNQVPVVPVQGKITFSGQQPAAKVLLTFAAIETEGNLPRLPGTAVIAEDGSYYVVTEQAGKGLVPGRYVANVECWRTEPTMESPSGQSLLPVGFKPAQELVVAAGSGTVQYDLDLPVEP